VRPSESQTEHAKFDVSYPAYVVSHKTKSEEDHLVSLELGGSNDITNLWPEVGKLPNPKDKVENDLHDAVCSGQVSLSAAQEAIASNWETAEAKLHVLYQIVSFPTGPHHPDDTGTVDHPLAPVTGPVRDVQDPSLALLVVRVDDRVLLRVQSDARTFTCIV
jgi:hypothetical protein